MEQVHLAQQYLELEQNILQDELALAMHAEEEAIQQARRKKRRRIWVRAWLIRRPDLGQYERLMRELQVEDAAAFKNFVRMEPAMFWELVDRLTPRIQLSDTWYRKSLVPGCRLAITLRHYATGDSYKSLMYGFRVAHNTISKLVREVTQAIIEEYGDEVLSTPTTSEAWKAIADKFASRWNFHNVVGALDGKHIAIRCPRNGGSLYFNYKKFHSIILMAMVDADYKFVWVDCGANGSSSDAQVFNDCELKGAVYNDTIGFPDDKVLPGDDKPIPYFIVGDDAFALRTWLMKPYTIRNLTHQQRIFNYRLSRARRIVENAFGILANRFGCLLTKMRQTPETVADIVLACCCLHNLLRIR